MAWKVTSGPASEPITTATAKEWLKVEFSADDTLISALITAARKHVERYTGTAMLTQTIEEKLDGFPAGEIRLSVSPLISVTSIAYLDASGDSQTVDAANYIVDGHSKPPRIAPGFAFAWPQTYDVINAVTITYTAGHSATTAANFPSELLTAMQMWMAGMYDTRQDMAKRYKNASTALMDLIRVKVF